MRPGASHGPRSAPAQDARRVGAAALALGALLLLSHPTHALGSWTLRAEGQVGAPVAPSDFVDAWKSGCGLGGSLCRSIGDRVQLGISADGLQFGYKGGSEIIGGTRRFGRVTIPLRILAWEHPGSHRSQLVLESGAGYVHESTESISGISRPSKPERSDGFAYQVGCSLSRILYRGTRVFLGVRYTQNRLPDQSLAHIAVLFGAQMPLEGSRPR